MGGDAEILVELVVGSTDPADIDFLLQELASVGASRWPAARTPDAITILTVTGGVLQLTNSLLDLRGRIRERKKAIPVEVNTADGKSSLLAAMPADLLTRSPQPGAAPAD